MASMKLTQKQILITAPIVAVLLLLIGFFAVSKISDNKTYSRLEKVAAAKPYADKLGEPERTNISCYPEGTRGGALCTTLKYDITVETCRQISKELGAETQPESGCKYAQRIENTDEGKIMYTAARDYKGFSLTVSDY